MTTTTRSLFATATIALGALFSTGAAMAQEATSDAWMQTAQSSKSRADVSAELAAARQAGLTQAWTRGYIEPLRQSTLRAAVKTETLQAIASGELAAINARVYGYTPAAPMQMSQAAQ